MNTPNLRFPDFQNSICRVIAPESPGGEIPEGDSGFVSDRHPFFELLLNLYGTCDFPLDDRIYTLTPGTAVVIPPWHKHSYGYRPCDTELIHAWIHFHSQCSGSAHWIQEGRISRFLDYTCFFSPELYSMFLLRWNSWKKNGKPGTENLYFRNVMNLFIDELLLYENRAKSPERNIVAEALALIHQTNGRDCTLDFLAKRTGSSKYHLAHRVREETGRTIGSFIDEARISYVHSAEEHGLSRKETGFNLGFSSPASFWNWYHKKQGK